MWQHGEKARGYQHIEGAIAMRQAENIVALETAVVKTEFGSFLTSALELAGRTIDAENGNLPESFR
jgi:hypothetical protein